MKLFMWFHKFLYKNWLSYGHGVYLPHDCNWSRYVERRLGAGTGIHGDPKNEYRVTRTANEFTISKEIRDWAKAQKIWVKFKVDIDMGNATYPRDRALTLAFIFLTREDAAQFKLTFL